MKETINNTQICRSSDEKLKKVQETFRTNVAHDIINCVTFISLHKYIFSETFSEMCPSVVWDGFQAHLGGFISHAGNTGGIGGITGPVAWQIGAGEGIQGGSPADTGTAATAAHWTSQWYSAPLCDRQRWQKIQRGKWGQFGKMYNKGKQVG